MKNLIVPNVCLSCNSFYRNVAMKTTNITQMIITQTLQLSWFQNKCYLTSFKNVQKLERLVVYHCLQDVKIPKDIDALIQM